MTPSNTSPPFPTPETGSASPSDQGFYDEDFRPKELEALYGRQVKLEEDIAMLRTYIKRVFAATGDSSPTVMIRALGALGLACTRMCLMLRQQSEAANADQNSASDAISRALEEVIQEMNLDR